MTPMEIVKSAVAVLDEKMARDIQVLQIEELTTLADYFIICTGTSNTHIRTLTEHVEHALEEQGIRPHHAEGHGSGTWVLMDYLSVVVHVFTEDARKFYQLDRVWADAKPINLDDLK